MILKLIASFKKNQNLPNINANANKQSRPKASTYSGWGPATTWESKCYKWLWKFQSESTSRSHFIFLWTFRGNLIDQARNESKNDIWLMIMTTLDKGKGPANKELTYFEWYGKRRMKCSIVIALRKCPPTFIDACKHSATNPLDHLN